MPLQASDTDLWLGLGQLQRAAQQMELSLPAYFVTGTAADGKLCVKCDTGDAKWYQDHSLVLQGTNELVLPAFCIEAH